MISNTKFYIIKLKKHLLSIIILFFTFSLLLFSKNNIPSIKSGILLWANSIVPSLFPFFVATELLMHTDLIRILEKHLNKYMKPIFNISGKGAFALIMGIISGYPVGAKIATQFRQQNICSKEECERLLSFTNNSGPLFIFGTIGTLMYKNSWVGLLLFISHILSCISVGIIFRFWKKNKISNNNFKNTIINNNKKTKISFFNLGEILSDSINTSISTLLLIGGFVIIFSSIISISKSSGILNTISELIKPIFLLFNINTNFISPTIIGLLEITNGIDIIASIPCKKISINIIITSFLLGLGGLSIFLQVYSITSKSDLSIKPYLYGKIIQSILSAIYTFFLIKLIPFFNFDL